MDVSKVGRFLIPGEFLPKEGLICFDEEEDCYSYDPQIENYSVELDYATKVLGVELAKDLVLVQFLSDIVQSKIN